ncbi:MAG: sugar phosphate nucleotidyltransferase [Acidimicrobiales bacterium]
MRAVVLVGGRGTRLRPLTLRTPKQMLPVAGRPMIERVLAHLATHGVDEAVLSLGYKPDAFRRAYPDATCAGVHLVYAVEDEPLDTAGAIRFAATEAGIDERFLVVNGDVLTDLDISSLSAAQDRANQEDASLATIALAPVEDPSSYGVVTLDGDDRVQAFVEKPPPGEAASNLVNVGYYVLEPEVLERIPPDRRVNIERETFPALVADQALRGQRQDAWWSDVGTPARFLEVSLNLLDRGADDVVAVADSAMVATSAQVRRCILGPGCRIGRNARVEDSIVFSRAVIGNGAQVRGSIVGASAVVGDAATVTDLTVLGNEAEVDGGSSVTATLIPGPDEWPSE